MFISRIARFMMLMLLWDELRVDLCCMMMDIHVALINFRFWSQWLFSGIYAWRSWRSSCGLWKSGRYLWNFLPPSYQSGRYPRNFLRISPVSCGFWALHEHSALGHSPKRRRFVWRPLGISKRAGVRSPPPAFLLFLFLP